MSKLCNSDITLPSRFLLPEELSSSPHIILSFLFHFFQFLFNFFKYLFSNFSLSHLYNICYDLSLELRLHLSKNLREEKGLIQLVKCKDTDLYLYYIYVLAMRI